MPSITLNDAVIHYEFDQAAGANRPVLIFSNSLGTDLSMWEPQVSALASKFRLLRYDTRGHGESSAGKTPYTMAQLGQDVVGLMDELDIPRASFCGLSMGGMIGFYLGINASDRIEKLILANTNAFTAEPVFWQKRIDTLLNDGGIPTIVDGVMARFFSPEFTSASPEVVAKIKVGMLATPLQGYAACCAAIRDMDFRAGLDRIKAPTLVIAGRKDMASPPESGQYLAANIKGARYAEIDAAHISNVEAPAQFTALVADFMNS